jgi:hypothetical protein
MSHSLPNLSNASLAKILDHYRKSDLIFVIHVGTQSYEGRVLQVGKENVVIQSIQRTDQITVIPMGHVTAIQAPILDPDWNERTSILNP